MIKTGYDRIKAEARMRRIAIARFERKFELVCGYQPTTHQGFDPFYGGLIHLEARMRVNAR